MSLNFPSPEQQHFLTQVSVGKQASDIMASEQYKWIDKYLFGAMHDRAMYVLRNAKNEEDRMKAQQMFLAATEPKEILQRLIDEGKNAALALQEISGD